MMRCQFVWMCSVLGVLVVASWGCGSGSASDDDGPVIPVATAPTPEDASRPAIQVYSFGDSSDRPPLRNKEGGAGNVRDTGFTVLPGDRIELKLRSLRREERKLGTPKVFKVDHDVCLKTGDVCVATEPVMEHRCEDHCGLCAKCEFYGCFPSRCCDSVCHDVHRSNRCTWTEQQCTAHQDQWKEVTVYPGLEAAHSIRNDRPLSQALVLLRGIQFRFHFADPDAKSREVRCSLEHFKPTVDAQQISLILTNVEGCPAIFSGDPQVRPTLAIVNNLDGQVNYSEGSLVKTWDGRVLEEPHKAVYLPTIDLVGSLSVISAAPPN